MNAMANLEDVARLAAGDHNLAVFTVARPDGRVQASVVSAGVMADPVDGTPSVAAVVAGTAHKLPLLREVGRATLVFKVGWEWAAVSGPVRLVGPEDGTELGLELTGLLRSVFRSAGGTHDDWSEFDRVMASEHRCAVFVHAESVTSNPGSD
jgi:hypothetical protein